MIATNEELALLEKWKRKLCLREWRIKLLTHLRPEEMTMNDAAGCTEWNLERLAEVCGYSEIGRVVDKLTREKMISLHNFERKERHRG